MNRLAVLLEPIKHIVASHPYLTGAAAIFSLAIVFLRKIHYRFVVYPDIGGRHNNQNSQGYRHPKEQGMSSQDIEVKTNDGLTLRGWYIQHTNPEGVLVYYHQNAGNIGSRLYFLNEMVKNVKVNILLIAYRGFSDSDGTSAPSEKDIMTDAKSILNKGIQLSKRDKLPLLVFGRSLGGASSINTLSSPQYQHAVKGLVLENTFTSIYDVAKNFLPGFTVLLIPLLWLVTSGSYNSINKISNVHVPILFIKGCKDTLIPKAQMDSLHKKYTDLRREQFQLLIQTGGHNDTWYEGGARYFKQIQEFIGYCSKL